ncbi:MAG TPA: Asp23/Gls24 family envelope stress response protein [Clostridiales bacterium]|nr:Asp23/Gls24 family envelope stress response protein [Clostridiales bacterium]
MADSYPQAPIKGEKTMSQGFVAQYAAEAAMQAPGVAGLSSGGAVSFKEAIGFEHEGKGVKVVFHEDNDELVTITVYPVVYFGNILPEVAWSIQEQVKEDVEKFTGLIVDAVNVHVTGVITREEGRK